MGQFKPMHKMETTEPSVVLKLKVGGFVNKKKEAKADNDFKPMKKMDGGSMGMMGSNMPPMIKPPVANVAPVARPASADSKLPTSFSVVSGFLYSSGS